MALPTARSLSFGRRLIVRSGIELCTITRTGETLPCRISQGRGRELPIESLPPFVRMHVWVLVFDDGSDVHAGDVCQILGRGTYVVTTLFGPKTVSISTNVVAVHTRLEDGTLNLLTNAVVTFRNPQVQQTLEASVFLYEASRDLQRYQEAAAYSRAVAFDSQLRYPGGRPIAAKHEILWEGLGKAGDDTPRSALISQPRLQLDLVSYAVCYFKEPG